MPYSPSAHVGDIPDNLKIFILEETEFSRTVDGKEHVHKGCKSMVIDEKTDPTSAESWAKGGRRHGTRTYTVLEVPNEPFTRLRFFGIDERSEGGRAYKVFDENNRLYDMREDIVQEALFANELKNGVFTGKYIWGKCGSQMRIIRVGSVLYKALFDAKKRKNLTKIPVGDFQVGGIYKSKSGEMGIFVGRDGRGMLFVDCTSRYGNKKPQYYFDAAKKHLHNIKPRKSHSYVEKVGSVNVGKIDIADIPIEMKFSGYRHHALSKHELEKLLEQFETRLEANDLIDEVSHTSNKEHDYFWVYVYFPYDKGADKKVQTAALKAAADLSLPLKRDKKW